MQDMDMDRPEAVGADGLDEVGREFQNTAIDADQRIQFGVLIRQLTAEELGKPVIMYEEPTLPTVSADASLMETLAARALSREVGPGQRVVGIALPMDTDNRQHLWMFEDARMIITEGRSAPDHVNANYRREGMRTPAEDYALNMAPSAQPYNLHSGIGRGPEFNQLFENLAVDGPLAGTHRGRVVARSDAPGSAEMFDEAAVQAVQCALEVKATRAEAKRANAQTILSRFDALRDVPPPAAGKGGPGNPSGRGR